jgi:hypothetical protein
MKLKNFEIAEEYLTSIDKIEEQTFTLESPIESIPEYLRDQFKDGKAKMTTHSWIDHPEFTKLRETLGKEGYISIQRGWWNGDKVLKPFLLNGIEFLKDSKFPSASALGISYKIAKENGRKTFSKY